MELRGSCLCGQVRYEVSGPFKTIGNCHCSMCRKAHGAAFATWGIVDADQFRWTSGGDLIKGYESSPGTTRCFCANCGSHLVGTHAGSVSEVVVGTVDGDPGARPGAHVFTGSKASWYDITDALPQYEEWPPSGDT